MPTEQRPFPKLLRLALWGGLVLLAVAFVAWYLPPVRRVATLAHVAALLANLVAVPYATWLLVSDATYRSGKNIGLAVLASIPIVSTAVLVFANREQIFRS